MAVKIITISREFGSGGRFIGEEVAKKLGMKYYDKDIIGQIAEQSGFSPDYIREHAELSPKKGLFAYAFAGRDSTGKSVEDLVYEAQRKVILEIAEKESCVIIGRLSLIHICIDTRYVACGCGFLCLFFIRDKHHDEKHDKQDAKQDKDTGIDQLFHMKDNNFCFRVHDLPPKVRFV